MAQATAPVGRLATVTSTEIPYGYCHCGCGQKTRIALSSHARRGYVKGEPHLYARGHRVHEVTPPQDRFAVAIEQVGDCWIWTGGLSEYGYGWFNPGGDTVGAVFAHRWSYECHVGPIPEGLNVLHHCDNPPCVNPAHLFVGDQKANVEDCRQKGRLGYEPRGGVSAFAGVWFDARRNRWVATLGHRGKNITVGRFATEEEAARGRDAYVRAHGLPHHRNFAEVE